MTNDRVGEQSTPTNDADTGVLSSLRREAYVFGAGTLAGFSQQISDWREHPADAGWKAGGSFAAGIGLALLQRGGSLGRVLATSAGAVMTYGFATDVLAHVSPTLSAMGEAWGSSRNLEQNKQAVANSFGRFAADSLLMTAGSMAGVGGITLYDKANAPLIGGEKPASNPATLDHTPALTGASDSAGLFMGTRLNNDPMFAPRLSNAADNPTLKYDIDQAKVMDAFGANSRAIPSMSVLDGRLHQQVNIVAADSPAFQLYEKVEPSVLKLRWSDGHSGNSGTAFPVEGDYLATAHHMVARSEGNTKGDMVVELADGREIPVTVVAKDVSADLALLRYKYTPNGAPPPIPLGWSDNLSKWDSVHAFGYPALANKAVLTQGPFLNAYTSRTAGSAEAGLETSVVSPIARLGSRANTWSGNSGGPLVNAKGEVVAVVTAGEPKEAESYSTTVEHLRLLLNEARKNPIPPEGLQVHSIGRVLDNGSSQYKVTVQKLNLTLGDLIEKPNS